MGLPARLEADVESLRSDGYDVEVVEAEPRYYVILKGLKVEGPGLEAVVTDLMMMADYQYPQSRLDMFWTDPPIRLANGSHPQAAESFEPHAGRTWQRWSWHYSSWEPARDGLRSHLEIFFDRISRGV